MSVFETTGRIAIVAALIGGMIYLGYGGGMRSFVDTLFGTFGRTTILWIAIPAFVIFAIFAFWWERRANSRGSLD